jgi:hypothetical protein
MPGLLGIFENYTRGKDNTVTYAQRVRQPGSYRHTEELQAGDILIPGANKAEDKKTEQS